jgi:hypothetical protein
MIAKLKMIPLKSAFATLAVKEETNTESEEKSCHTNVWSAAIFLKKESKQDGSKLLVNFVVRLDQEK